MPYQYTIDEPGRHVRVTGTGRITMESTIAVIDTVTGDPRFRPEFTLLMDLRAAEYTADLHDGDALAQVLRERRYEIANRFAVVVPESLFMLIKLYCLLANVAGYETIRCFIDAEEAERWCREGRGAA
jgi:hypothetical protein